jgi:hypothetical protein
VEKFLPAGVTVTYAAMLIANQPEIDYPIATGKATRWLILILVAENSMWKQKLMQSASLSVQMASFSGADLLCVASKSTTSFYARHVRNKLLIDFWNPTSGSS